MSGQCYDWHPDTNTALKMDPNIWVQCPEGLGCCVAGSTCLDHNICHANSANANTAGSFSQYYIQRCADPTYTSPYCQKVCNAPGPPDVVYNYNTQEWACCGLDSTGNVSCNAPTNEIFQAPPPAQLATISTGATIATTATIVPGSKTSSDTSTTSTPTSTSDPSSRTSTAGTSPSTSSTSSSSNNISSQSSGLSTGAEAGIGVGVAVAVIAIIALITFLLLRRRKRRSRDTKTTTKDKHDPLYVEKGADPPRTELAGEQQTQPWSKGGSDRGAYQNGQRYELDNDT